MAHTLVLAVLILSADPYRATLVDNAANQNDPEWSTSSAEITPQSEHAWSITKKRLHGGKQEGVDVITIDNGVLQIVVVPTRGMGIWQVTQENLRLGWDSPVKEIVHPQFVNLTAKGGLGWLEGFGEWMCRCGLENNGHPGEDVIVDNTGAKSTVALTLHGKQAYLPAQNVTLEVDRKAPYRITLRGLVRERMMHGPKLDLVTEISTEPGSNKFRISDVVTNASGNPTEFQLLYHCNFGPPLLEKGSTFVGPMKRVIPFNDEAAKGDVRTFATYSAPTPGYVEQVYCVDLNSNDDGQTTIAFVNAGRDQAASMQFSVKELPFLTVWKNTADTADGYVTGIEPGTNFPYTRRLERVAGRVPKLAPGEKYAVTLEVGLHVGSGSVEPVLEQIRALQGNRSTEFVTKPNPPKITGD